MMFLLASIWIRLERLLLPLLKPFDALALMETAQSATIFVANSLPSASQPRLRPCLAYRVPVPVHPRRPSA
jgi:hypothetical protein